MGQVIVIDTLMERQYVIAAHFLLGKNNSSQVVVNC